MFHESVNFGSDPHCSGGRKLLKFHFYEHGGEHFRAMLQFIGEAFCWFCTGKLYFIDWVRICRKFRFWLRRLVQLKTAWKMVLPRKVWMAVDFRDDFFGQDVCQDVSGERPKIACIFQLFRRWARWNVHFARHQTIFGSHCSTVPHFGYFEVWIWILSKSKVAGMGGTWMTHPRFNDGARAVMWVYLVNYSALSMWVTWQAILHVFMRFSNFKVHVHVLCHKFPASEI